MKEYNPHEIEPHWQKVWADTGAYTAREDESKPKRYVLEMFLILGRYSHGPCS